MAKAKDGSECFTRTGKGGGKYVTCKGTQKGGVTRKATEARKELRKKVPEKKTVTKAQFENARRKLAGGTASGKSKKPAPTPKKKLGTKIEKPSEVKMTVAGYTKKYKSISTERAEKLMKSSKIKEERQALRIILDARKRVGKK